MSKRFAWLGLLVLTVGLNTGCSCICCLHDKLLACYQSHHYPGCSCGERYLDPWHNDPPDCCDPCDGCGNWIGRTWWGSSCGGPSCCGGGCGGGGCARNPDDIFNGGCQGCAGASGGCCTKGAIYSGGGNYPYSSNMQQMAPEQVGDAQWTDGPAQQGAEELPPPSSRSMPPQRSMQGTPNMPPSGPPARVNPRMGRSPNQPTPAPPPMTRRPTKTAQRPNYPMQGAMNQASRGNSLQRTAGPMRRPNARMQQPAMAQNVVPRNAVPGGPAMHSEAAGPMLTDPYDDVFEDGDSSAVAARPARSQSGVRRPY